MRKCEIAVGVVDLLEIPLSMLLWTAYTTMVIGGAADGPTAIYLQTRVNSYAAAVVAILISPFVLSGVLLLIPSRRKVIVLLSVLFGFLHAIFVSFIAGDIYDMGVPAEILVSDLIDLLLIIANMSLFFRRGVKQWWKKKDPLPPIEP